MERLFQISNLVINAVNLDFTRYLFNQIKWENRLIGIVGARGVGKTTLLLQYLKKKSEDTQTIYVTAEDVFFNNDSLIEFVHTFYFNGGRIVAFDEIHQYKNWSKEIKVIYDSYPELQILFTGSSILELNEGSGDLSRRVLIYHLNGLSFREYLNYTQKTNFKKLTLEEILNYPFKEANKYVSLFKKYLNEGYYPFFNETEYFIKLQGIINKIIDDDLVKFLELKSQSTLKLKRLLGIIASQVPFKPNISKIAELTNINRMLLPEYFNYLEKAGLIHQLQSSGKSIRVLGKADKVYLANTSLIYALSNQPNIGNLRETFFVSQLIINHKVDLVDQGDFKVDDYIFEIGGKSKNQKQIKELHNSFIVKDDIFFPYQNVIPLWYFGFLY